MARKTVRWGHVDQIKHVHSVLDRRYSKVVPTKSFTALPLRLKHLSAWRAMHLFPGGHETPQMVGTRAQVRPSSNLSLKQKLKYLKKRGG